MIPAGPQNCDPTPRWPAWVLFDWGDTLMRTFEHAGPMKDWPRVEALPGALEVLRELHGRARVALATNAADSREGEIREALARVGLDAWIDRIFCYRSVGFRKSTPAFFRRVLDELACPPAALVMVGDDWEQDVQAPNAQGIRAVWLSSAEPREGDLLRTLPTLHGLPALLAAWPPP